MSIYIWLCVLFLLAIVAIVWSSRRARRPRRALPTRQPSTVDIAFDLLHRDDLVPSAADTIATTVDLWIDAFRQGDETGVIELARLYMQGIHPTTRPNKIVGGRICSYVLSSPLFSKAAKLRAREMLQNEMFYEYFDDLAGHETLSDYVLDQLLLSEPEVVTRKIAMVDLPPEPPQNREYMDLPYFNLDQVDLEQQRHLMQQIEVIRPVRAVGDSQNVHSSTVQKGASIALTRFENEQEPHAETPIDFESYVRGQKELSNQEKANALDVHRSLLRDVKHSRYDRSEKEVFDTMWNRVTRDRDDHLMSTFARSLGSAVENGVIVCSTGKIVRMIGSIDGMTDDAPNLRPEWALDSELAQIAVRIRNEQAEGKEDEMIEHFRREATDTYKDLIPKDILEAKIEVFAEGFD